MRGKVTVFSVCAAVVLGLTVRASEKPPEAYQKAMKDLAGANMALRAALPAKDYDAIAMSAGTFKASFAAALSFWTAKKTDDAIGLAQAGAKAAADLEAAAKAKNEEGVQAAAKAVGSTCAACHMAHREQLPDKTYEIK